MPRTPRKYVFWVLLGGSAAAVLAWRGVGVLPIIGIELAFAALAWLWTTADERAASRSQLAPPATTGRGFDRRKFIAGLAAGGALVARPASADDNQVPATYGLNVRDFGAVGDGVTDDTPAFLAWAIALKTQGKTLGLIPDGTYRITQTISFSDVGQDYSLLFRSLTLIGTGSGSRILLDVGPYGAGFLFGNMANGSLRDLVFVGDGTYTQSVDCGIAVELSSCFRFELVRVGFVGVGYQTNAVLVSNGGTTIDGCYFYGTGGFGDVLKLSNWSATVIRGTDFIDYGWLSGKYYSKVGAQSFLPPSWICAGTAIYPVSACNGPNLSIEDCEFDENGYQSIRIDPGNSRLERVSIVRCRGSIGTYNYSTIPSLSYGEDRAFIRAGNIDKLLIQSCWSGYSGTPHDSIRITNCGSVQIQQLVATYNGLQGATRVRADANTSYLELQESEYSSLVSDAHLTRVLKNGSWARLVVVDGDVTSNTLAVASPNIAGRLMQAVRDSSPSEILGVFLDSAADGGYARVAESGQVVSVLCDGEAIVPADPVIPSQTSPGRITATNSSPQVGRSLSSSNGADSLVVMRFFHA
jgi:hypothetical protein